MGSENRALIYEGMGPERLMNDCLSTRANARRETRRQLGLFHGPVLSPPEVLALKHESSILGRWSNLVSSGFRGLGQASSPWAKPVLHGPNSRVNLFHHGKTTYRVG